MLIPPRVCAGGVQKHYWHIAIVGVLIIDSVRLDLELELDIDHVNQFIFTVLEIGG